MYALDAAATHWINGWSGGGGLLDRAMIGVTAYGVPLMVLAVAGQWWLPGARRHTRHVLVASGLAFLSGLALNQAILLFVQRLRPYDGGVTGLLVAPSADPSFPSDHATAAMAIAAAFLAHGLRGRGLAFLAAAGLVALSRVYVGTHYLSDVVGGAAIGAIAALAVRGLYREGSRIDRAITGIL